MYILVTVFLQIVSRGDEIGGAQLVSNEKIESIVNCHFYVDFNDWLRLTYFSLASIGILRGECSCHNQSNEAEYFVADLIHVYNSHFKLIIYYNFDLSF